jgi:hypothetical protein
MASSGYFNVFSALAEIALMNRARSMFREAAGTFCPNRADWR